MWTLLALSLQFAIISAAFDGGRVATDLRLSEGDSPFIIEHDIIIEKNAKLTVDPGVEMRFAPQVMVGVNGTFYAKGTATKRILLTKDSPARDPPQWPDDIRLVDERSVHLGRLQMLHQSKWRGICANSVNWTEVDVTVACRQLGFAKGASFREYHEGFAFLSFPRNDTLYMLYYQPNCTGGERSLTECPGYTNVHIGKDICINQQTVHLYCEGLAPSSPAHDNWWGLEFYNATYFTWRDYNVIINESSSVLEHLDLEFAGVDQAFNPVPAIRASPTVPHLTDVTIKHCALDATNFTGVMSSTIVHDSVFTNNRGNGFAVESHLGRVSLSNSEFYGNHGNGIKAKLLDGKFAIFNQRETFCEKPVASGVQGFPQLITGTRWDDTYEGTCARTFRTAPGQIVTLNILEMEKEPDATGTIELYNGRSTSDKKLATFHVHNGTLPQGITSTTPYMYVVFKYTAPYECPTLRECIKFTLLADTGPTVVPEFSMENSQVTNNTQHGLFLENVRHYAFVNESEMSHNQYGAGMKVFGGAGDVHINASRVLYNQDTGVNITYGGGMRIVNRTVINNNLGNGLNVTLNETRVDNKTRYSRYQRTEVSFSDISYNEGHGVRVGNFCHNGIVAVNDTSFLYNRGNAVDLTSCFKEVPVANATNFTVAYNTFVGNLGHAIKIAPLLNAIGRIANNTFREHLRHTVLLDNSEDYLKTREYTKLHVDYEIEGNQFTDNYGFYVLNLRLTERSSTQAMRVRYNVFKNNVILGKFDGLNERTKTYAVILISSSNIVVLRNWLEDPESRFEVATQLQDTGQVLDVREQWWHVGRDTDDEWSGLVDYRRILPYLFDQNSRYNLAGISYHPALKYPDIWNSVATDDKIHMDPEFERGDRIGGKLVNDMTLQPGKTYHVDRDINILPDKRLTVKGDVTLQFENSLGVFVQGAVDIDGASFVKLLNHSTHRNSTTLRLVDGYGEWEGRLEVRPDNESEWGTVCEEGWTQVDAAVACQMLGLVIHPKDWRTYIVVPGAPGQPIWRSNVQCSDLDMDIMQCPADDHMDHSCTHDQDVYVRCYEPTWGGIRFAATAVPSRITNALVEGAGLFDASAAIYQPAIKIDYNTHELRRLTVRDNLESGIIILHNDVYANAKVVESEISNNYGNGISTRYPFFAISFCQLKNNRESGFDYNPTKTTLESLYLRAGIHNPLVFSELSKEQEENGDVPYKLVREGYKFLVTKPSNQMATDEDGVGVENTVYWVQFESDYDQEIVVDVLDWNPDAKQENLTLYARKRADINDNTKSWVIEDDLVDFPLDLDSRYATLEWTVGDVSSGRLTFVLRSKPANSAGWGWPFPKLLVENTTSEGNQHGLVLHHYNQPSNEWFDIFYRFRWEYITVFGVTLRGNQLEAMHVPSITKYHELYLPTFEELQRPVKIAEIRYEIEACHFAENGGVMLAEHNHVEFSNNVWIWYITHNLVELNRGGGFFIELPKVNLMYSELYNHSVEVNDTIFENNQDFEFRIEGFYCNATVARNRFQNNVCKKGCISVTGTEKDLEMYDNEVIGNAGVYMTEFHMTRHTPYNQWVEAVFEFNNYKDNVKLSGGDSDNGDPTPSSSPTSYTLGIKGLQNITVNRNRFDNPGLDYELVGGQDSSSLEIYLDATQNWWGTSDQDVIQWRIFDFADWNNYAIVEYYPYLTSDHPDSPVATAGKTRRGFDISGPIGGPIVEHVVLRRRSEPYVVNADLTVMPSGSLVIESGVEMQFYPNVGILVLGTMTVNGKSHEHVKFNPVDRDTMMKYYNKEQENAGKKKRKKRNGERKHRQAIEGGGQTELHGHSASHYDDPQIRLYGGHSQDEGFIQFYNATERRWTLICDDSFNDRTAEVACKTMLKESSNVVVRRTPYYDIFVLGYPKMHEQTLEWFWRRTYICDGTETDIDQCRYKQNYHLVQCMREQQYVYVKCGARNLAPGYDYWGNVRFSSPDYEHGDISYKFSVMDFVDIYGAGILHGEKAAAVQSVHRTPSTDYTRISNCAWNGYDYIAPRDEFSVKNNHIENVHGYGIGGLILNGESDYENSLSSFTPLRYSEIPYNTYGFVRMCTTEKLVYVKDRLLLYYKYRFDTIDCIKIIRSKEPRKQVAVRFLQLNLYNDSFYKNAVEMYNGEYFDYRMLIGEITPKSTESDIRRKYETVKTPEGFVYDTMGIRVTASPAYGDFGFIAEVVTIPLSPGWKPDFGPGSRQSIQDTTMVGNQRGGFRFSNVGELNPAVIIERCRIQDSGYMIYNLSAPPVMSLQVQNSRLLTIANNYIVSNRGGIFVNATSNTLTTAINSNITNNVMVYNTHGEMLHVEGHHYQSFTVQNNYISHNQIDHRNVVAMLGVSCNFSLTNLVNNTGMTMINSSLPEQISITQRFFYNGIYNNYAIGGNHTTVFLKTAKARFHDNFFLNTYNKYDMVTYNRTKHDGGVYPDMDATMNWWGSGNPAYVAGRIWDRRDDDNLIRVNFEPFHERNDSLVQGRCYPGWQLYDKRCYWYMGGVAPYEEAQTMCKRDRGTLARALDRDLERFLGDLVSSNQANYNQYWRTWVWHEVRRDELCSVLRDYNVEHIDCDTLLPYICEKSPYVQPTTKWRPIIIALGVTGGILIIICLLVVCACIKSRQRKNQRLDRKNSLRMSRTSLRGSKASIISGRRDRVDRLPEDMKLQSRRRPPLAKTMVDQSFMDISGATTDETSDDSIAKAKAMYNSNRPYSPASTMYSSSTKPAADSSYFAPSELGGGQPTHRGSFDNLADEYSPSPAGHKQFFSPTPQGVENEIANIAAKPMFDYKNQGFTDDLRSLDRSQLELGGGGSSAYRAKPRPPLGWTFGDAAKQSLSPQRSQLNSSSSLTAGEEQQRRPGGRPPIKANNPYQHHPQPEVAVAAGGKHKPRPPIGHYPKSSSRPPLGSDSTLGETRGQTGGRSKPHPHLASSSTQGGEEAGPHHHNTKSRPPLSSSSTIGEASVNQNPAYHPHHQPQRQQPHQRQGQQQQPPYPRDWTQSRETLGSTSSGRSLEDRPRPKETDM